MVRQNMVPDTNTAAGGEAMAAPVAQGFVLSTAQCNLKFSSDWSG